MNVREYVKKCDADFKQRLFDVVDAVQKTFSEKKGIKILCLSGPTCSGKTTAANMLAEQLERSGRAVHIISIDDFYYDREYLHELSAKKGIDGIDYDSEDTIDLCALDNFVKEALEGRVAHCPTFDFKLGERTGTREVLSGEGDVFIFEGIQAIYPSVVSLLSPYGAVSVYIAPLSSITYGGEVFLPDEIRFMRRIVRDANFRGARANFTINLWKNVRKNEERNIFPYAENCDYKIDSTHNYELGVLRPYLERMLTEISKDDPSFCDAEAMLSRLSDVEPIDSALIEENSLYKEFV